METIDPSGRNQMKCDTANTAVSQTLLTPYFIKLHFKLPVNYLFSRFVVKSFITNKDYKYHSGSDVKNDMITSMRIGGNAESRLTAAVLCLGIIVTDFFLKNQN